MEREPGIYSVGCDVVDVTPPVGVFLAGYGGRNAPSDGVYHRLCAVSTVIDDGGPPLLLVSIEWLGLYDRTEEARRRIAAATGIAPERMVLSGTHTHCGPVMRRNMDKRRHGAIDEEYIDRTLDALAQSARRALDRREPARLRQGADWCGFAASRRRPLGPGGIAYKPSPDAPHDHEVGILAVEGLDGGLRQLLFSYACHPITAGPLRQIGGDFVAYACDYLEETYKGVTACFFQGCAGDQKADVRDAAGDGWRNLQLDEVNALGQRLGQAVERVADGGGSQAVVGAISVEQTRITLQTEPADDDELAAGAASKHEYVREWAEYHLGLQAAGEEPVRAIDFEVQTVRLGRSLLLITMAGEMSVEYGLGFKREWGGRFGQVWTLGYTNEIVGYVPVRRQIPEGGYEVVDNHRYQLYTGPFTENTEEAIRAAVRRSLAAS
ncbi:MAG: hypothetical protein GKR89_24415 [Candidatus Latescibacteria bacterium]|nr:hypothetical protein [Candidatus Latescibacterota bacterium]